MKIYTSYFANISKLKENDITPISIALYNPSWYKGYSLGCLAPSEFILKDQKEHKNDELYEKRYREFIEPIFYNRDALLNAIENLSDGKDVALCCYEKPDDFCHRHIVASLFKEKFDIDVEEFKKVEIKSHSLW